MDIKKLSNPITPANIEFRADRIVAWGGTVYCFILPYKTARFDMLTLDMVCGELNWQNEYKRDSQGVLQCGIGIYDGTKEQWIWKWSNGTPSQFESSKGEYSDAMKRAGFMWGIGRDLYDFPTIKVALNEKEYTNPSDNNYKLTGYFKPNEWEWVMNEDFSKIVAKDKGKERFNSNPYKKDAR